MMSFYKKYIVKIVLLVTMLITSILLIVNFSFYYLVQDLLIDQLNKDALSLATSISYNIEKNIEKYEEFLEKRELFTPYHNEMLDYFEEIKKTNPSIRYIYTCNRINITDTEFILDSEIRNDPTSVPGVLELENTLTIKVMNYGKGATIDEPTNSIHWGLLIGACSPIFKGRELVGTANVDIDISSLSIIMKNIRMFMILSTTSIIIIVIVLLLQLVPKLLNGLTIDNLTLTYNKKYTEKLITENIKNAIHHNMPLTVMMLDLDHFKNINDTYGHSFGDVVLRKVSKIIKDNVRLEDTVIRYGGEEFLTLILNKEEKESLIVAERIRSEVEKKEMYNREYQKQVKITISIGLTKYKDGQMWKDLVDLADKALYEAKKTRNCVKLI